MIRVSRVGGREGESFISPGVQRERIDANARSHGNQITAWFEDLDESGAKWERPGFQAALALCESGELDGIVVAKLDRFARSVADAATAIRQLEGCGCELVSVAEGLDTSTPYGRFGRNIMFALAELELEQRREGWDTARERAIGRGVHFSSRVPVGYVRGEGGRLEPDPVAAPLVTRVFRDAAAGASPTDLARLLTDAGVRGASGAPRWTRMAVAKILRNRAYLGEARSGEYVQIDAHPALVSVDEWEDAQRPSRGSTPTASTEHLLSGLIRCAGCRHVLQAGTKIRQGVRVREYTCRRDHADGRCPAGTSIRATIIEPVVEREILKRIEWHYSGGEKTTDDTDAASMRLAKSERIVSEWRDDTESAELLGRDSFLAGLRSRVDELTAAQEAYADARARSRVTLLPGLSSASVWAEISVADRRQIIAGYIDAVVLRGLGRGVHPLSERVRIFGRGEMPDDWPRRGRVTPLESVVWDDLPDDSRISLAHDG